MTVRLLPLLATTTPWAGGAWDQHNSADVFCLPIFSAQTSDRYSVCAHTPIYYIGPSCIYLDTWGFPALGKADFPGPEHRTS